MARKFGKKTHVSLDPLNCSLIFLGQPKVGKTSLMKEVAEKTVGEDGYLFLEMYRESGANMIEGIVAEDVETWGKFKEIVEDIEANKDTDYKDLKVVFIDTWDNAILLAEKEALRLWNKENPEKRTDNILAAYGGFNRGPIKAAELLDDMKFRLEAVGIRVSIIMHVRDKELIDPVTEKAYHQITSNVSQTYFNRIKSNADIICVAYVDRDIALEQTGRKDIKGNEVKKSVIKNETRKIKFRDQGFAIDAGGRLKHIVDEIDFDSDQFIDAITNALKAEVEGAGVNLKDREKEDKTKAKEAEKIASENSAKARENKAKEELEEHREEYLAILQEKFKDSDAEVKDKAKALLKESGVGKFTDPELDITILKQIAELFN